jgi:hypothetical protein
VEKAGVLFHLAQDLQVEFGVEYSFKMCRQTLLPNRFLITISKDSIEPHPQARILDACDRIDMPAQFRETFLEKLPTANYVHFGFEENARSCLYKAYLEFWTKWEDEITNRPERSDPFLLYLGFKWDASDHAKHALARYTCYPLMSAADIMTRLRDIYQGPQYEEPRAATKEILDIALARTASHNILYLEVSEGNNPRRSFDMNMYRAKIPLKDLHHLLSKMCQNYSIPTEEFDKLYEKIDDKMLGHVSGGIDRQGQDFLTIYYKM